jgi:drug/metabolite transporter (DMT)-like permease
LFLTGVQFTNATTAALFGPLAIVITAAISVGMKNEKGGVLKFLGMFVAVAGALMTIVAVTLSKSNDSLGFSFSISGLIGCLLLAIFYRSLWHLCKYSSVQYGYKRHTTAYCIDLV